MSTFPVIILQAYALIHIFVLENSFVIYDENPSSPNLELSQVETSPISLGTV